MSICKNRQTVVRSVLILLTGCGMAFGGADFCFAQFGRSDEVVNSGAWPPNAMTSEMRRCERLLDSVFPQHFNLSMTGDSLIAELQALGLPIVIDQSALDDSFSHDEPLEEGLPLPNAPLRTRLGLALKERNATITMGPNHVAVISLDDAEDTKYFVTVTYDVTGLGANPYRLCDLIMNSVHDESWLNTGQGLGQIVYMPVAGRDLITVSQEYGVHRGVQQLLGGIHRLTGSPSQPVRVNVPDARTASWQVAGQNSASQFGGSNALGSTAVIVPRALPTRRPQPVQGGFGGSQGSIGNNEGGGGGGVFGFQDRLE